MDDTGRHDDTSTAQIRRKFDSLAIPRRSRAHSLDSIDTLGNIESHRQHRLNYLKNRAKFEKVEDPVPVSPVSSTVPRYHCSALSTDLSSSNSSISASLPPPASTADTLSHMLERITSELSLLNQEDDDVRPASRGPVTRATVVEGYIPAQVPMKATVVSTDGMAPATTFRRKNRVSFETTPPASLPDATDRGRIPTRSNSFQFLRPSTFLRQSSTSLSPAYMTASSYHASSAQSTASAGINSAMRTVPPLSRQTSSTMSSFGQAVHTPRPVRRHVSFGSAPLGDIPRRSTTSSVPVKTLVRKFSVDE